MPAAPPRPPRPGWYADPRGGDDFRWWDGVGWTSWLADSEYAPRPRGDVPRKVPVPALAQPRSPRWLLAGIAVAVVLVALAIVSLVGQRMPQRSEPYLVAMPSDSSGPTRVYRAIEVRSADRAVVIQEQVWLPLPQRSYVDSKVEDLEGILNPARVAYADAGSTLTAATVMGIVEPGLVVPGDIDATARRIQPALMARYDPGVPLTLEDTRIEPWRGPIPDGFRMTFFARFPQPIDGNDGAHLTVVVVPWDQGGQSGHALWAAIVPAGAPEDARRAVTDLEQGIRRLD
ncbi:DUF2510 domain-containing protein [Ammonicoccus fulvus]|uniref:DUF2510 domain-containing protein n=1 Tax=Ammonicoccus fulvus TaxID=3138240 RepID=A0ABZ3FK34_9ACTN